MTYEFSALGALLGLLFAIILIIKKVPPVYSLILGAFTGGLIGGGGLQATVDTMITGAQSMMSSVLRIMTSGILAGALIQTGSAEKIAETIVKRLGEKRALFAIAAASMILCAVGVFADIVVITVAPIALAIGNKGRLSCSSILLAMIGGCKAGNIISPNPNTIAAAEAFSLDLTALILKNVIPAIAALIVTGLLSGFLAKKARKQCADNASGQEDAVMGEDAAPRKNAVLGNDAVPKDSMTEPMTEHSAASSRSLPTFPAAISGPVVVILLLALRSLFGINIDPLLALPLGGLVSILATGQIRSTISCVEFGLSKVIGVSILLIGTGTIAGIIKASALQYDVIRLLDLLHMPAFVLAPLSGILMAGAASSTTAGATIASQTFAPTLQAQGVPALSAAAMIHAGSTVLDSLPHGSFFHATGGAVGMSVKDRMKLIPYEACVGLTSTVTSVILFLL